MEELDITVPIEEQEIRIRKKMAQAGLDLLNGKYAAELPANELLQVLHAKLENDTRLSERLQHPVPEDEPASVAIERYRKIYSNIIRAQRGLLDQLNKKDGVDEVLIRKFSGMLDLDEEKMRLQFGFMEDAE